MSTSQPSSPVRGYIVEEPESYANASQLEPPDSAGTGSLEIPAQPSEKALGKMRRFSTRFGKEMMRSFVFSFYLFIDILVFGCR
jgi:hypothetical protein